MALDDDSPRPATRGDAPAHRGTEEPTELGPLPTLARSMLGRLVLAGVVLVVIAAALIGARSTELRVAVAALLLPLLIYLTIASNRDRRRDEESRRYLERHGRWPSGGSA